jgi:hypothetical protein
VGDRVTRLESVQEDIRDHLQSIDAKLAGMTSSIAMLQILTVGVILAIIAGAVATILTR